MTQEEFKQLDDLMDKLLNHMKHRCCLIHAPHDGYCIGIYDNKTGNLVDQATSHSIEDCADKLLARNTPKQ